MNASAGNGMVSARAESRADWVDAARGLGIVLVVYGHVLRSLMASGVVPNAGAWAAQDSAIYAFHMPLFFLLAGLFAERGIVRGRGAFLRDKLVTVVWPYLLWSLVNGSLQLVLARHVHDPMTPARLAGIWWRPIDQFWFLYALLLCQLVAAATLPRLGALVAAAACGGAAVALADRPNILFAAAFELPFFVAGVAAIRWGVMHARPSAGRLMLVAAGGWGIYLVVLALADLHGLAARYLVGFGGIVGTVALTMMWLRRSATLRALGQASMAIYVTHVIVTAGLRVLLERAGIVPPPPVQLALGTVAGLALPWLLFVLAQRHGWSTALGLGRPLGSTPPR